MTKCGFITQSTAVARIPATKGFVILVDAADERLVTRYKWQAVHGGGLYRPTRRTPRSDGARSIFLYAELMRPAAGLVVDHINGDPFDNRRENLRICTSHQNLLNARKRSGFCTSRFKGVSRCGAKFQARITLDHRTVHLGTFATQEAAAAAYDVAALDLHGEYAKSNAMIGAGL